MRKRILLASALVSLVAVVATLVAATGTGKVQTLALRPLIDDPVSVSAALTPPTQAQCKAINRRCFNPTSMANSYDYASLHAAGNKGQGTTIAIVDSFGGSTIRQDLGNFNTQFGLPHLCGETGPSDPSANCSSTTTPRFDIICFKGCPAPTPPPPNDGTGLEYHNLWAIEVALDVEWAHATAPLANIMLVTTPTAETLGMQGFQQMMNAEDYVVTNHLADVITQSFGAGEGSFNNGLASLKQLRQAFVDAQANKVTVFASSGDGGSTNGTKQSIVGHGGGGAGPDSGQVIPYPSVLWPTSDPLVTSVGGTYLCTNAVTGIGVDSVSPPANCQSAPGDREPAWVVSGGGYSIFYDRPSYQNTLPPGSTYVGSSPGAPGPNSNMRGVPDIAYQASSRTGVLVYSSEPFTAGGPPNGWFIVGGTSASAPQWAGLIAIADQMKGSDLGFINPKLYALANNAVKYAADFYDPTVNSNGAWSASKGWDAVTGLGTPDAAKLIPDLIAP